MLPSAGRSCAIPKVFLFDEPLSNLDAALRVSTRTELIRLHERLGATMIYVTHDQVEAMTMGSRICIMCDGRVSQIGKPMDVYLDPADTFVASFLGNPPMNLLTATAAMETVMLQGREVPVAAPAAAGQDVIFGIRPEDLTVTAGDDTAAILTGEVIALEPLGAETIVVLRTAKEEVTLRAGRLSPLRPGERVALKADLSMVRLFDGKTGKAMKSRKVAEHGSKLRA